MPIKFADDIIKEIINRGEISVKNNCVTGEEFEKWLRRENFDKEIVEIVEDTKARKQVSEREKY